MYLCFFRGRDLPVDLTTSAKSGVAVFKASMLNCKGQCTWVYVHCAIYETYFM